MTYEEMLFHVRHNGKWRDQRAKLADGSQPKALTVFAPGQIRYDLRRGFPLITTKYVPLKLVAAELIWFLSGRTDLDYLHQHNCHIWDEWATCVSMISDGYIVACYGQKWRNFGAAFDDVEVDQIAELIDNIKKTIDEPHASEARRLIVSAWEPNNMPPKAPPACHTMFQCDVDDGFLNLQMYQRSADMFLGVPFNIASYALLTHILARITGLTPGILTITLGNAHIYANHIEQVDEQLTRKLLPLPRFEMNKDLKTLEDFENADPSHAFWYCAYDHHPPLKGEVAV